MSTEFIRQPPIDLKRYLARRVLVVALFCFAAASALMLVRTYRDVRASNQNVADAVLRQLETQLFRIESNIDVMARFPDWDPVANVVMVPGQCVRYLKPDGQVGRSSCVGSTEVGSGPSAWFTSFFGEVLAADTEVIRSVAHRNRAYGTLVATMAPAATIAAVWKDIPGLLAFTAVLIASVCVLQFVVIGRALRPTREVLAGLDRVSRGDFSCRLPDFRLIELQRISEVFNTLAASLDRATREKAQLAVKLVEGQEQERLHLARDLHDELAQNLSAMSAVAASIRMTARTDCPALAPEADRLSTISAGIVASLRQTLRALRPPEIDDLGLATSLAVLTAEQERRSGGRLKVALEADDDIGALPPTMSSHVYRIVQEGLTNVVKHSDAGTARVVLELSSLLSDQGLDGRRQLTLLIQDDGPSIVSCAANAGGLGLVGMHERVMALGGELTVSKVESGGLLLHAVIPVDLQKTDRS